MSSAEAGPAPSPPPSEKKERNLVPFSALDPQSPATSPKRTGGRGRGKGSGKKSKMYGNYLNPHPGCGFRVSFLQFRVSFLQPGPYPSQITLAPFLFTLLTQSSPVYHPAFFHQRGVPCITFWTLIKARTVSIPSVVLCSAWVTPLHLSPRARRGVA